MKKIIKEIQQHLIAASQNSNHDFFNKMIPGQQKIYGVKTPILNEIAKQNMQGSFELAEALWQEGSLEERVIAVKILEKKGKEDPSKLLKLFTQFAGTVDNWAVCDGLGMQFLHSIRKTHATEIFSIAKRYNSDKNYWKRRLSLVMVEWYTRMPECHAAIKQLVKPLENDTEYYVKKAVTWINRILSKGK